VSELDRLGGLVLSTDTGTDFAVRPQVKAGRSDGKPAAREPVMFEIVGDTDAKFASGKRIAFVHTHTDGLATAPVISAGNKMGSFVVRASLPKTDVAAITFLAIVKSWTVPEADRLARTSDEPLESVTRGRFGPIRIIATVNGNAVAGTVVTATILIENEDGDRVPAESGPYFLRSDGKPVHTLMLGTTGEDGMTLLPKIFTGKKAGAYTLRLITGEGVMLNVPLAVTGKP
jgi:hypothetical protein